MKTSNFLHSSSLFVVRYFCATAPLPSWFGTAIYKSDKDAIIGAEHIMKSDASYADYFEVVSIESALDLLVNFLSLPSKK